MSNQTEFSISELSQMQIALSSRIEFLDQIKFVEGVDGFDDTPHFERIKNQKRICENVLERIRGGV